MPATKSSTEAAHVTRGLILVPTRELAEQVYRHLKQLTAYCDEDVVIANAASGTTTHLQRYVPLIYLSNCC